MAGEFHGFDWDRGNREKCQKHGVSISVIEELFLRNALRVEPDIFNSTTEQRFRAIGKTKAGRSVFLVFTLGNLEHVPPKCEAVWR